MRAGRQVVKANMHALQFNLTDRWPFAHAKSGHRENIQKRPHSRLDTLVGKWCYAASLRHWYENVPSNQPRCRLPAGETCQIVDRWSMAE